jgi:cytochrome c peroxidase
MSKKIKRSLSLAFVAVGIAACAAGVPIVAGAADQKALMDGYRRVKDIPFDKDNPFSKEKADLGYRLFFDKRLGFQDEVSCASCHLPALGWGDGFAKSPATLGRSTPRHSMSIANLAWDELFFWDGRADSLEAQMLVAIAGPSMNTPHPDLEKKVKAIPGYAPLFARAFPGTADPIVPKNIAAAIGVYERTVVSGRAPFDDWLDGKKDAISSDAQKGFALFNGKANCAKCHNTWRFTDGSFHDIGLPGEDPGRGRLLPKIVKMQKAFKTPTLRDVALSAPYFHDGSVGTLIEVINHYDKGGIQRESLSDDMKPLGLSVAEKQQLLAFLATLTSYEQVKEPALP